MKRKPGVRFIICMLILCAAGAALLIGGGKKPYRNLDVSEIVSAEVRLTPPDETIQITEIEELVGDLKEVVAL